MKIVIPGHWYKLDEYDTKYPVSIDLKFLHRVGQGYPGNTGKPFAGTNCQEVIRALIDRVKYLDDQIACDDNKRIISDFRYALLEFERRAAMRHGAEDLYPLQLWDSDIPAEKIIHCGICGHIACEHMGSFRGFEK